MKKNIRKIILMAIMVIIPFAGIINVNAKENMTITRKTYINTGINNRKEAKFYTNKGYAYCVAPDKVGANQGAVLTYKGELKDGGLRYILENAKTSDKDYLIAQLAIWKYYNNALPDIYKKNKNKDFVKKALELASKAEKHKNDKKKVPSISIKNNNSKMKEVDNGKYFKSDAITINLTNLSSAKVTVTSPAVVLNSNGKKITTVKDKEKIYIRVTASEIKSKKTFTVKLSGSSKVPTTEKYSPSNAKLQDLGVLVYINTDASNKTSVSAAPVVRKCEYANGKYYGKNGNVVDKTTYSIECEKHTCEKVGNTYFGKNGNVVDKTTYSIECEKHTCELVGNTYFGKNGNIVDQTTYSIECGKHACEKVGNTYFGRSGNIVDATQYDIECNKHTCEVVGDKLFGKNGNIVDEVTYDIECNKHVCQKVGDVYFGKDGNQVTADTYDIECNKHTCEKVGDVYFGKNGIQVTEDTYNAECTYTCQKVGDKFYGINGNEVDEATYKDECVHACEIYDNKYFGKDGLEVDKATYQDQCEEQIVQVPDTKVSPLGNLILTIIGGLFIGTAMAMVSHFTKISVK